MFDKGRGFIDLDGKTNILEAIRPGYSLSGECGVGLTDAISNSDEYEIESAGKLWNSRRIVIPFFSNSTLLQFNSLYC